MESKPYLKAVFEIVKTKSSTFNKLVSSPLEFTVVEACILILEQFDLSSKLLSGQKEPTLHQIIPSLFSIHTMIINVVGSNQVCKEFEKNFLEKFFSTIQIWDQSWLSIQWHTCWVQSQKAFY